MLKCYPIHIYIICMNIFFIKLYIHMHMYIYTYIYIHTYVIYIYIYMFPFWVLEVHKTSPDSPKYDGRTWTSNLPKTTDYIMYLSFWDKP